MYRIDWRRLTITPEQLRQAAAIQERIQAPKSELAAILNNPDEAMIPRLAITRPERWFSAAAIANIRAGAKARWAKFQANHGSTKRSPLVPKRAMSAAAEARLSAIAKARWKKAKAAGKTAL